MPSNMIEVGVVGNINEEFSKLEHISRMLITQPVGHVRKAINVWIT